MVDIISTGFIFGVGFVCGSCSALVLGGKVLEFCRFGFVRVRFVRDKRKKDVVVDRSSVSRVEDVKKDGTEKRMNFETEWNNNGKEKPEDEIFS